MCWRIDFFFLLEMHDFQSKYLMCSLILSGCLSVWPQIKLFCFDVYLNFTVAPAERFITHLTVLLWNVEEKNGT